MSQLPRWLNMPSYVVLLISCSCYCAAFSQAPPEPVDVLLEFYASGYMGDTNNIQMFESWVDVPCDSSDTDSFCVKIRYIPGNRGFAGQYWQNLPDNWGAQPGNDYSGRGYNIIEFWAKGENGGELIEFKAGDINDPNLTYHDSFTATLGRRRLTRSWTRYTISLLNKNLASVIGGFCWVSSGTANPRGVTFFVDRVTYKKISTN